MHIQAHVHANNKIKANEPVTKKIQKLLNGALQCAFKFLL